MSYGIVADLTKPIREVGNDLKTSKIRFINKLA
jgi:hypothetical protein